MYFLEEIKEQDDSRKQSDEERGEEELEEDEDDENLKFEGISKSEAVQKLIRALEFNAIDMYRWVLN